MNAPSSAPSDEGFFHASCPGCGAPVRLASSASAFAVCGYCHSSLARNGETLQKLGTMSEVLEDYSVLQLGAAGRFQGEPFTVVGRIQMAYPGGFWNEWHVLFGNGKTGWLSDASGQYAVLIAVPMSAPWPAFSALTPGRSTEVNRLTYVVADRREAQCVAAEGELPFAVSERWTAQVADLRRGTGFVTLDYSESSPVLYEGASVSLASLAMQGLRSDEDIRQSAGALKGALHALSCPSCGASVTTVAGGTPLANCGSCGAVLDVHSKTAKLLEQGSRAHARVGQTFLRAGDSGTLKGVRWTVMGVIRRFMREDGETWRWTEYLLYSPKAGFRWLSETTEGWLWAEPLEGWPAEPRSGEVTLSGAAFRLKERYDSQVEAVWGSFNYLVRVGDSVRCEDFAVSRPSAQVPKGALLVRETDASEQSWSLCTPLAAEQVAAAFGKRTAPVVRTSARRTEPADYSEPFWWAAIGHGVLWLVEPSLLGFLMGVSTVVALGVMMALENA